jgi:hypothetical protein
MEFAQLTQPLRKRPECWIAAKKKEGKLPLSGPLVPPAIF